MATATLKAKLTLNDSLFQAGIKRAGAAVANFGKAAARIGFNAMKVGITLASAAMAAGGKSVINLGDELLRMKRITGISVESLFILREAFEQAGTGAEGIGPAVGRMQKNLFGAIKAASPLRDTIQGLGIDFGKLMRMRPDEQFLLLGKAINELPDIKKQAVAMEIFGKAGLNLLPVFAELKDFDAKGLEKQAKFMDKNAEAFDNANDSIRRMKTLFSGLFGGAAVMILPVLEKMRKAFSGVDFVGFGQRLSAALSKAVKMGLWLFQNPQQLWDAFIDVAKIAITKIGPFMIETLMRAAVWYGKAIGHVLGKSIFIAGEMMFGVAQGFGGALIDAFMQAIAYLDAGLTYAGRNFASMLTGAIQTALQAMGIDVNIKTKGISWKDAIKQSKAAFVKGGTGEQLMRAGSATIAKGLADLKTMFKGGGLERAAAAVAKVPGPADFLPEKDKDKYGKGNWRMRAGFGTLKGASMAAGLSTFPESTLKGASLLGGGEAAGGGAKLRSSGMIWANQKRRMEKAERDQAAKGIDKTNNILEEMKGMMQQGFE